MPLAAGRLGVKIHSASLGDRQPGPDGQLFVVVEIEEYGRLRSRGSQEAAWDQDLTLEIGPQATKLKVCLYEEGPGGKEELVGQGSLSLVQLLDRGDEDPGSLQSVAIPLVNQIGKSQGQVQCSLRYFHSRTPGKFRDPLGRETIDDKVLGSGPREGPKKVNEMSPVASPRARSRAGSPVLSTPVAAPSPLVNASS